MQFIKFEKVLKHKENIQCFGCRVLLVKNALVKMWLNGGGGGVINGVGGIFFYISQNGGVIIKCYWWLKNK